MRPGSRNLFRQHRLADIHRARRGGRDVIGLASLQLLSVPALPQVTNTAESTSVTLTGNVSYPGAYAFQGADPQNVSPITETVNGDSYTGPPFFNLINPSNKASSTNTS